MRPRSGQRIAIVGSGIAGLGAAHRLGRTHDVVVYESDSRLGGHAHTVDIDDPAAGPLAVDTGFIVHNDRTYPRLVELLERLGVATQPTEMSFAVTDRDPRSPTAGFTYRATSPNTLFADRRNLTRPAMWRMLRDIRRFFRDARRHLDHGAEDLSLDEFLRLHRYSREFVDLHLIPMGSAVWSADPTSFGSFPARSLFTFLRNHGLLSIGDRPQWRTIVGGSRTYVDAVARTSGAEFLTNSPVRLIRRGGGADERELIEVVTDAGPAVFDAVIVAVHSDQALRMLESPTPLEHAVLGSVRYVPNRVTLHTDVRMLPPVRRAWAAWNVDHRPGHGVASVTYDLTSLQRLPGRERYLVSVNSDEYIDARRVVATLEYSHPVFDQPAVRSQRSIPELNALGGVYFAGAWCGYGFHEDGLAAAAVACDRLEADIATGALSAGRSR